MSLYREGAIENDYAVNEMDEAFGPSNYPGFEETLPQYEVSRDESKVSVMGREIYKRIFLKSGDKKIAMHARICPIYPKCVAIFPQDNFWLQDQSAIGEFCSALQKTFGGGPCPHFKALYIWAGFCQKGIDPSEFAGQFEDTN